MQAGICRATGQHIQGILAVVAQARARIGAMGFNQWQNGYPNRAVIQADVAAGHGWVAVKQGRVLATAALCPGVEDDYIQIHGGQWLTCGPYAALHRVAVADEAAGSGLAGALLHHLEGVCRSTALPAIRVDTHRENQPMRRFLEKNGFAYCGVIYLAHGPEQGAERVAYEKLVAAAPATTSPA